MFLNVWVMMLAVAALTVVFVSLFFYFRAGRVAEAQATWKAEQPPLPEHTYVQIDLGDYIPGLVKRLALWVYAVPLGATVLWTLVVNLAQGD
jgi:hypothetical protein